MYGSTGPGHLAPPCIIRVRAWARARAIKGRARVNSIFCIFIPKGTKYPGYFTQK